MPLTTPTTPQSFRETLDALIGPELASALEKKGFDRLTPVQEAVLKPELQGRDLRISSQTGSGKTVAIGLALRDALEPLPTGDDADDSEASGNAKGRDQRALPRAFVVTPTRELAKQVEEELTWLYEPVGKRVACVTGGGGYRDELRAFRSKPAIIVGTPGRLLDHLKRGAIDATHIGAIVFDEADRMLDLGFREDLEAILAYAPKDRRTHLVSATFSREVRALADRVQNDAVAVEGTPLGTANLDIEHVIHLVHPRQRLAAIINLLLENPGAQSLIFARTRADVADIAHSLGESGFNVAMLSGEMEQAERNRALASFKRGNVDALVATDVAARGIDVQDVARVIHAEPPTDADAYTHRSGRTGRAGKKGTSSVLVAERELSRTVGLLGRARVRWSFAPIPTAEALREASDRNLLASLTADFIEGEAIDERSLAVAQRILGSAEPTRAVGRLVSLAVRRTRSEPQEITPIAPPTQRGPGATRRKEYGRDGERSFGNERDFGGDRGAPRNDRDFGGDRGAPRNDRGFGGDRGGPREDRGDRGAPRNDRAGSTDFVAFRVSWGESHGADARRLVAMMCRRGQIEGRDIGAIRVGRTSSVVEVSTKVAADFEQSTSRPDPRDPRVHVRRWSDEPTPRADGPIAPAPRRETTDRETIDVPAERPSRATPKDRPSVSQDRPSVPKDRSSVAKDRPSIPKDQPSVPKERHIFPFPTDRPSVPRERLTFPKEQPSIPTDLSSIPEERPSVTKIPNDRPSVAKVPKDRPSIPKDRASVAKDRPSVAKEKPAREGAAAKPAYKRKPWEDVQTTSKRPEDRRNDSGPRDGGGGRGDAYAGGSRTGSGGPRTGGGGYAGGGGSGGPRTGGGGYAGGGGSGGPRTGGGGYAGGGGSGGPRTGGGGYAGGGGSGGPRTGGGGYAGGGGAPRPGGHGPPKRRGPPKR